MSKSTKVSKNGFTPFANGGCQSLLNSARMGSTPLLMVEFKVYHMSVHKIGFTPFSNGGCQSLLKSARMGSNPLLMGDVKVYHSQWEMIAYVHIFQLFLKFDILLNKHVFV